MLYQRIFFFRAFRVPLEADFQPAPSKFTSNGRQFTRIAI